MITHLTNLSQSEYHFATFFLLPQKREQKKVKNKNSKKSHTSQKPETQKFFKKNNIIPKTQEGHAAVLHPPPSAFSPFPLPRSPQQPSERGRPKIALELSVPSRVRTESGAIWGIYISIHIYIHLSILPATSHLSLLFSSTHSQFHKLAIQTSDSSSISSRNSHQPFRADVQPNHQNATKYSRH